MRVMIAAIGSMGDVLPYTGLAARIKAAGHDVSIAAYGTFAETIRECGAEFREIPGDPTVAGGWTQAKDTKRAFRSALGETVALGESILAAAKQGTDAMLVSVGSFAGVHVAESLDIPSMGVFVEPLFPTADHLPSFLGVGGSLGPVGNRAVNGLFMSVAGLLTRPGIKELRSRLGLTPLSGRRLNEQMSRWPVLHGYSAAVLPKPDDYPPVWEVAGYFWPHDRAGWEPAAELADFIGAGPPPVYVSFGSRAMTDEEGVRIAATVEEALSRAEVRGVLQAGWAGLVSRSERVLTIGQTDYRWLFPRMAAVVHHCGAGTTAAGLRAGVPTVPVPILASQPFWASRIALLGAGTKPIPYRKLTASALGDAIAAAVGDASYQTAAAEVSRRIAEEDGAGQVIEAIDRITR
jgi:sterol 3beta-glucosyltransferase